MMPGFRNVPEFALMTNMERALCEELVLKIL